LPNQVTVALKCPACGVLESPHTVILLSSSTALNLNVGGNGDTLSSLRHSGGLPSTPAMPGTGDIYFHGGHIGDSEELGIELSNLRPVRGNPTMTQEMDLLTQNPPITHPLPVNQDEGMLPSALTAPSHTRQNPQTRGGCF
jgi:hypothetical protein